MIRLPQPFLDARNTPYSPRVRLMMLILDGHCRGLPYTWYGNASLAEEFGCELRNLKELLREMDEDLGLIRRVISGKGRKARLGIVMRKRADPDLPAAETDEELADAIARLTARRERASDAPSTGQKNAPAKGQKNAPAKGQKNAPELRSSSSEDASRDEGGGKAARSSRRRPETAEPDATSPVPSIPESPDPAAPPDGLDLAPGPLAFLAGLTPEQRKRFDGWSEAKRALTLAAHAGGLDRLMLRATIQELAIAPPPPLPAADASAAELIAACAGRMGGPGLAARAARAVVVTLGAQETDQSFGSINALCLEVAARRRPAESLSEPLGRTLAELRKAAEGMRDPVNNPAGYWTNAVRNWDREHSRPGP